MFLRNWANIQVIRLTGSVEAANPSVFGEGSKALKYYNGTVAAGSLNWFGNENYTSSTYYSCSLLCGLKLSGGWTAASGAAALMSMYVAAGMGPVLAVGSGTAKASYEDYTLTDITSLTHVSYSFGKPFFDKAAKNWTAWVGRTLTNSTGADVTVSEIGIYLPLYCGSTSSMVNAVMLICRELLSVPVTIPNGGSFTFGLRFRLPV